MFDPNASQITITDTAILLRGAVAPAPIVDRRIDGRLLVAAPGKKNRWLILDRAHVPALLAKRIKAPSKCVEERIVCPVEDLDATVAMVEAWVVGGGKEADEAAAAKRAASAAKRAATVAAKAEAARQAQWEAEAPAREATAAARAEVERARQEQWAQERRARELAAAAARRAEDARMNAVRANRALFNVAVAPAVGEAFEVEGDGVRRGDRVLVCESLGRSWIQAGVSVCYAYGRPATDEEAAAYRADRPRSGHVTLLVERAPAVGERFRLRDGSNVVCTSVGRPFTVDETLDEEYTSFYSSDFWEQRVVRVDYEHVDAPAAPAMVLQQAQQQQACAAITMDWEQQRDDLLCRIEGTEHLQRLVQGSVDRAAAGLGTTTATQDSVEALRLHAVDLRQKLAALDGASVLAMVPQIAQQQQARDNRGLRVITNPNPATHCSHCGRRLTDHISVRHGIGPVCRANGGSNMRDLFTTRSDFDVEDLLDVILVVDLDRGGRSVSNDASGVIDDLRKAGLIRPGVPVVYRDSSGTWDQLRVKDGRFAGFASVGAMTREDAIAWARVN